MNPGNDLPRMLGDRYEIGEVLGRGGMAEVHLCRDHRLERLVAVKMLRSDMARDPVFQARFRREAHSAAALNHPSVVAVYDTGEDSFTDSTGTTARLPYIVMEHVEGRTVKDILVSAAASSAGDDDGPEQRRGPGTSRSTSATATAEIGVGLGTAEAAEITAGVLTALDYSHRQGIVHRDIKPANVMVTPDGVVKVMDFGIARALSDSSATMTQTSAVIGTAQYLSPEQARGETVDQRTDLYSTGCLLYELLTGRPPFVGDSPVSVAYQHVREQPEPPSTWDPTVSPEMDRVVMHSLAKDREDRYPSAADFRRDLAAAAGGRDVAAPTVAQSAEETRALAAAPTRAMGSAAAAASGYGVGSADQASPGGAYDDDLSPDDGYRDGATASHPLDRLGSGSARLGGGDEPARKRSKGPVVAVVLAVLVALGLLGAVLYTLYAPQEPAAPAAVSVPSVIDQTQAAAESILTGDGLKVDVEESTDDTAPEGQVFEQDPRADAQAQVGDTVTITVSTGPEDVTVPDVSGRSETQATLALRDLGIIIGDTTEEANGDVEAGDVIRTEPAQGTSVAPGSAVTLVLSTGNSAVPDLVGSTQVEAANLLGERGFKIAVVEEATGDGEPGTVVSQDPPADAEAPAGATVTVTVATALPEETTTTESPTTDPDGSTSSPSTSASPGASASPTSGATGRPTTAPGG